MNNSLTDIHQLRNDIDFASIAQFFHTFQSAFRPWPVTTHDVIYSRILDANDYVFETEVKYQFSFFIFLICSHSQIYKKKRSFSLLHTVLNQLQKLSRFFLLIVLQHYA